MPPKKVANQNKKSKKHDTQKETEMPKTSVNKWQYGDGKTSDHLIVSSWNVNGFRAVNKKKQLLNYIQKLKPDILCLSEIKLDQNSFQKQKISQNIPEEYYQYWNFCKTSSGYSGVAIFSKFKAISCFEDLGIPKHDQQGRMIRLQFEKFFLINVYVPNSGQKLVRLNYRTKQWDEDFLNYIQKLKKIKNVIICGDLNVAHQNIDIAKPESNLKTAGFTIEERNNFTSLLEKGWVDTFRKMNPKLQKFSWWSFRTKGRQKNIGWRLDYFIVNQNLFKNVVKSQINNDIYGSDHCPIELQLNL